MNGREEEAEKERENRKYYRRKKVTIPVHEWEKLEGLRKVYGTDDAVDQQHLILKD